jgi:hypothetical protein
MKFNLFEVGALLKIEIHVHQSNSPKPIIKDSPGANINLRPGRPKGRGG